MAKVVGKNLTSLDNRLARMEKVPMRVHSQAWQWRLPKRIAMPMEVQMLPGMMRAFSS